MLNISMPMVNETSLLWFTLREMTGQTNHPAREINLEIVGCSIRFTLAFLKTQVQKIVGTVLIFSERISTGEFP